MEIHAYLIRSEVRFWHLAHHQCPPSPLLSFSLFSAELAKRTTSSHFAARCLSSCHTAVTHNRRCTHTPAHTLLFLQRGVFHLTMYDSGYGAVTPTLSQTNLNLSKIFSRNRFLQVWSSRVESIFFPHTSKLSRRYQNVWMCFPVIVHSHSKGFCLMFSYVLLHGMEMKQRKKNVKQVFHLLCF